MEKFYMKLADRVVAVSANFITTKQFCEGYLLKEIPSEVDIEVNVTREEIESIRDTVKDSPAYLLTDVYLETLVLQCKIAEQFPKYGIVLFHGSAVALDGEVYIFTAPSGTGKSTHTRLWRNYFGERAFMVNDDKPFLCAKEDGSVMVYGAPWDGKHHLSKNVGLPLKGICILSQAAENKIRRVAIKDAFQTIYKQTYKRSINTQLMKETLDVLSSVMKYPIWQLECNVSQEALKVSYEAMSGKRMEER